MVFSKTREIKEIMSCYFANADMDNSDVVLVDKQNEDNIIVFSSKLNYKWNQRNVNGIGLHMEDRENKIDIRFKSIREHDNNLDILILDDRWMLDLM